MVYVTLRNGKVIQYNDGNTISSGDGVIAIQGQNRDKTYYLIARIPLDIVERAEFGRPCRIMKSRPLSKNNIYYP